jgi:uncharacterized protein YdeI (YjbR/CyaY-like superfamily)
MTPKAQFFKTPAAFRAWLRKNHRKATELQVGYFKKHTNKSSITWPESVAEALCFGWIDGIRRRIDDERYVIRFTPRRPGSKWSAVNVRLIAELEAAGKMTQAGRDVFESRPDPDSKGYTYDRPDAVLDKVSLRTFKKNKAAWAFFEAQPPGYCKKMIGWIMSAKKDETRHRRLDQLIRGSADGKRLA